MIPFDVSAFSITAVKEYYKNRYTVSMGDELRSEPVLNFEAYLYKHKHNRNLYQDTDDCGQCCTGGKPKEHCRGGDCDLEVIGCPYHC